MKITARLKKFLIENCNVKADATDQEFRKAAYTAMAEGELTEEKLTELTKTKSDEEANGFMAALKGIGDTLAELQTVIREEKATKAAKPKAEDDKETGKCKECGKPVMQAKDGSYKCKECGYEHKPDDKTTIPDGTKGGTKMMSPLEKMLLGRGVAIFESNDDEKDFNIRVKEAADQYATTKSAMVYPKTDKHDQPHIFAGQQVKDYSDYGRQIDTASERDLAVCGAFAKFFCQSRILKSKNAAFNQLRQHDRELLLYALQNEKWSGRINELNEDWADVSNRKLTDLEQKALIDDATSGGLEAAPIVFDDRIIETPLLYGELFPLVNRIPLDRGRRVEGVATGTVTGSWGGIDATAISLFTTTSYVSAFDTTIFRWQGSVQIGRDFLSDTPIDFGAHFTRQYGERLLEDLDDVIATGNGTTQPEGVMTKSGTTSVTFSGTTSIGNYESLRFGVDKNEHKANLVKTAVFCGNETSYQRVMALPVGSSDARRLFGEGKVGGTDSYDDYMIMNRKYAINESMANTKLFYAILGRYRMYVRRGLTVQTSTDGDTLLRNNALLIVVSARYGGQLERGGVAAVTTDAPA